jgi:hypothetical protein
MAALVRLPSVVAPGQKILEILCFQTPLFPAISEASPNHGRDRSFSARKVHHTPASGLKRLAVVPRHPSRGVRLRSGYRGVAHSRHALTLLAPEAISQVDSF